MSPRPMAIIKKELEQVYKDVRSYEVKVEKQEEKVKKNYDSWDLTTLRKEETKQAELRNKLRNFRKDLAELEMEAMGDWLSGAHKNRLKDEAKKAEAEANRLNKSKQ